MVPFLRVFGFVLVFFLSLEVRKPKKEELHVLSKTYQWTTAGILNLETY